MTYDLFTLGVLAFTTYRGAAKGIAWQLAAIAALVLCFVFATPLSLGIAPAIPLEAPLNRWVAMLGIYLVFSFGTFALARSFRDFLEKARFEEYDKHLGAVFGFIKGITLSLVVTFFVVAMSEQARDYILHTHSGYAAAIIMDRLHPVMPGELHDVLDPYIHNLDRPDMNLVHRHDDDGHFGHDHDHDHGHSHGDSQRRDRGDVRDRGGVPTRPQIDPRDERPRRTGESPRQQGPGRDDRRPGDRNSDSRFSDHRDVPRPGDDFSESLVSRREPPREPIDDRSRPRPRDERPAYDPIDDLLSTIPGLSDRRLRDIVRDALLNTDPAERSELVRDLEKAPPSRRESIVADWRNRRPGSRPSAPRIPEPRPATPPRETRTPPRDWSFEREQLMDEISVAFSDLPAVQDDIRVEIEYSLEGLPDEVAYRVLADWHSDLWATDPDPDPATDLATSLDRRILRQLDRAGVPRRSLSAGLRERLDAAERR